MPDTEELKIVVSLDDQATAKLQQLRQTVLGSFSGHGMEKLKRDQGELTKSFKDLIEVSTGGERAMLGFIGKLGAAGGAIAAVGYTISETAKKIYDASNKAKAFGIDPAEFAYMQDQFKKVGVSGEEASKAILGLNKTIVDISHPGSMKWVEMLRMANQAGGQAAVSLGQLRQQLLMAHTEAQRWNALAQAGENIYANRLNADMRLVRQGIESVETARMDAAEAENVWLAKVANTDRDTVLKMRQATEMTAELHKKYDILIGDSKQYEDATRELGVSAEEAGKFLLTAFGPEFSKVIHQDAEDISAMIGLLDKAEAKWREWTGDQKDKSGESPKFSNFTDRLKDQLYLYLNPIGGAKNLAEKWLLPDAAPVAQHFGDMGAAIGAAGAVGNQFRHTNWDRFAREARASTNIEYAASYFGGTPFAETGAAPGGVTARGRLLDDNTRELKRLNDQLFQILNPIKGTQGAGFGLGTPSGGGGTGPGTAPGSGPGGGGLAGTPSGPGNIGPGPGAPAGPAGPGPGSTPGGSDGRITPSAFSYANASKYFGAGVSVGGRPTASAAAPYADITQGAWGAGPSAAGLGGGNAPGPAAVYAGGGSIPKGRQQVAAAVADEWRKAGMSEAGIAGVLANIRSESAFNPTLRHPDQPAYGGEAHFAHGLYQEGGAEWNHYAAWLQKNYPDANWQDPTLQSRFAAENLKTRYPKVWERMSQGSKEQAAAAYVTGYLKPAARYQAQRVGQYSRGVPDVAAYTGGVPPPAASGGTIAWTGTPSAPNGSDVGPGTGAGAAGGSGYKWAAATNLGRQTAGAAGIKPAFPVDKNVNWENLDAEYLARMNAAYRAMPAADKANFHMISGYRPATRTEARALGMPESSSQEDIWERSAHGTRFAAARPGASQHQRGQAGDYARGPGLDWLHHQHTAQFGLQNLGSFDYPHIQLSRMYRGPNTYAQAAGAHPTAVASQDDIWKNAPATGGSTFSFADEDRNAIDRGGVRHHRLTADGQLRVHVNAPAGTHVAAEGKGLFKQVHLHRQMQMMAAGGAAGMDHRTTPAARVADRFGVYEAGTHGAGG